MMVKKPPVRPLSKALMEKKKIPIICSKFPQCNGESWKTSENISICISSRAWKGGGRHLSKLLRKVAKLRERWQNLVCKLDFMILEVFLKLMILRFYKRMGQELFLFRADYTTS